MVEVIFYKGNDPLSKLIKWWTGGRFSHCGFLVYGKIVIDTDLFHGVRVRFLPWKAEDYETLPAGINTEELIHWAHMTRGRGYDLLEGFRRVLPFIKDQAYLWNCAEYVYDTLHPFGTDRCLFPDDIYKLQGGNDEPD